jgi:anhydro-N-acetylmuramic acid kinase
MQESLGHLFVGVISGTSMDSIDTVLVNFTQKKLTIVARHSHPFPERLRSHLAALQTAPLISLQDLGEYDMQLGELFAEAVLALVKKTSVSSHDIKAIGSHGQNICHSPKGEYPFTMQIGNPHRILERTGISVVADFRQADVVRGGQGAPLAPLLHREYLSHPHKNRLILNLGGIANITLLPSDGNPVIGFDTGPANGLLDAWALKHKGQLYDAEGQFARSGKVNTNLLKKLLSDAYFTKPYPKSTGKEYFNLNWLSKHLIDESPEDVQATLLALTVQSIKQAVQSLPATIDEIFVYGGGIHNTYLIEQLAAAFAPTPVASTEVLDIKPMDMEALLFAWLAKCRIEKKVIATQTITGSRSQGLLGALYE